MQCLHTDSQTQTENAHTAIATAITGPQRGHNGMGWDGWDGPHGMDGSHGVGQKHGTCCMSYGFLCLPGQFIWFSSS